MKAYKVKITKKIVDVVILVMFAVILTAVCKYNVSTPVCHKEHYFGRMVEIEQYFVEMIPELELYARYIERESEGKACLTYHVCQSGEDILGAWDVDGYYIYVGEEWEDHRINWDWFWVKEDLSEIYYYDIVDGDYWTLEEWRASERYREGD